LLRRLVLRADVAARLGDETTARTALIRATAAQLTDQEQKTVRDDLRRLEELRT
jgi:hypothetical protein